MQLLEAGIDRIHDSDEFKRYLKFSASFHRYSPNNQILIWMQKPEASMVAGFNDWKKKGRHVNAGERAIKIFAPLLKKELDPATGDEVERLRGYRLVNVFDVGQTQGKALPEAPRPEDIESSSEAGQRMFMGNWDYLASRGVTLVRGDVPGVPTAKGSYLFGSETRAPKITVRSDLAMDMQAKTLAHESAHYLANHKWHQSREEAETVAESTAFVTAHHFGVDTAEYSFDYITHWSQDRELFRQKLNEIGTLSKTLITGIEGFYRPDRETSVGDFHGGIQPSVMAEGIPQRLPSPDELHQRYE